MNFLRNMLCGMIIGVANIIPGVSGGTMAVVLNIYDKAIDAVSGLRRNLKNNALFLFPIGVGAVAGIVLFSKLIKFLLGSFPMPTNFFFLGLIIGSFPMIYRRATREPVRRASIIPFAAALAVMLGLTFLSVQDSGAVVTSLTPLMAVKLTISGAVAAACMILPGISGSMVLMLLGDYTTILTAISDFNITLLVPVGIGILIGLFGGAKIISVCLARFEQGTYFAILGLILGSVLPVLMNAGLSMNLQALAAVFTLLAGMWVALWMVQMEKRLHANEE